MEKIGRTHTLKISKTISFIGLNEREIKEFVEWMNKNKFIHSFLNTNKMALEPSD